MNRELERALARQREILDSAKAENRDLNEAEIREFNELQETVDNLTKEDDEDGTRENEGVISAADAATISNMCRYFGIDAGELLSRGLTVDQARAEIIKRQMDKNPPINSGIQVTADESDKVRRAMTDGILLRGGGQIKTPADGANNYRSMSVRDIAIECLERDNGNTDYRHMRTEDLLSAVTRDFYNPTSAFPAILDDVVQKSYVEGLTKARVSFDKWVRFGTLPNFKKTTNHEYIMSLGGKLEKVPENGELKSYVPKDVAMPERQLETYGRQFTMSRQAFINDDIGLITTMPRRFGEISMKTQNEAVYRILLNNSKIFDGKTLFSDDRKNTLKTGTDVTLDVIQKMIYMIGIQKDSAGNQLALVPDIFIVPFGLGVEVQKILSTPTFYSAEGTTVNPYYNSGFEVIEDVTMNGFIKEGEALPWFMGMKNEIIQIDYLNGQKEATIRRSEKPGTLGFVWDVYFDFGVSMLHPQAICRNPGIAINMSE